MEEYERRDLVFVDINYIKDSICGEQWISVPTVSPRFCNFLNLTPTYEDKTKLITSGEEVRKSDSNSGEIFVYIT